MLVPCTRPVVASGDTQREQTVDLTDHRTPFVLSGSRDDETSALMHSGLLVNWLCTQPVTPV